MNNHRQYAMQRRVRRGTVGLVTVAVIVAPMLSASLSSANTVSTPARAVVGTAGRFTSAISFDDGLLTVRPAPANTVTGQRLGAVTAKIWASAQLSDFAHQTLGWGYVTVKGTPNGEAPVTNVLGWVGFANGNASGACTKNSAKKFGSNGEAVVFLGDANLSPAVSYVPARCGFPDRAGYRVPDEVVSVPWVQVGSASVHGLIEFRTQAAQCGSISGVARLRGTAVEVLLVAERPDWSAAACSAQVVTLPVPIGKTAAKANATRLVHGASGPVRQVANA